MVVDLSYTNKYDMCIFAKKILVAMFCTSEITQDAKGEENTKDIFEY